MVRKTLLAAALLVSSIVSQAQGYEYGVFRHLGVNVGVGTPGITADLTTSLGKFVDVRAGVDVVPGIAPKFDVNFKYKYHEIGEPQGTFHDGEGKKQSRITANFKRVSGHLMFDIYPFASKGATFFLTVGAALGSPEVIHLTGYSQAIKDFYTENPNVDKVKVVLEKYELEVDKQGNTFADLRTMNFRPYFGLGWGRACPKSRVSFRIEAGAYYHGSPKVYYNGAALPEELSEDVTNETVGELLRIGRKLVVYPVLKFGVNVRIL